ncbi:hypothetical protein FisN_7Lh147 [Fistulifera solaris]|uniref:Uncharacterized protein n=1 Tax=Fistulifera solaris TaxID=1519565 RepID=A0A1Z5JCU0_FISSO|nr:hypothetical protein FisN_7Lh147 [Fistulifera solaris]|eukprot:GAX11766.1 hypothetical protein FisN_7Lh147 [Fistulifera solaris]
MVIISPNTRNNANAMCSSETIDFDCEKVILVFAPVANRDVGPPKAVRGMVRFRPNEADIVGTVPLRKDITEDEKRQIWWTAAEYQGIRLGAKFITKDLRKREKSLVRGIEEAYARALHLACTLSDGEYELLMKNCASQALCMKSWCARDLSARGLECYTSHKHRYERAEFAEETRVAVLKLARTKTATEDQLSVFYKEYARSAAIFARFCGEIDSHVSPNDPPDTHRKQCPAGPLSTQESLEHVLKKPSQGRLMVQQLTQRS